MYHPGNSQHRFLHYDHVMQRTVSHSQVLGHTNKPLFSEISAMKTPDKLTRSSSTFILNILPSFVDAKRWPSSSKTEDKGCIISCSSCSWLRTIDFFLNAFLRSGFSATQFSFKGAFFLLSLSFHAHASFSLVCSCLTVSLLGSTVSPVRSL